MYDCNFGPGSPITQNLARENDLLAWSIMKGAKQSGRKRSREREASIWKSGKVKRNRESNKYRVRSGRERSSMRKQEETEIERRNKERKQKKSDGLSQEEKGGKLEGNR